MSSRTKRFIGIGILLSLGLLVAVLMSLTGSAQTAVAQTAPTATPTTLAVPFVDVWQKSPHNASESEAFAHWNEEETKAIPETCAACHSGTGYQDFVGADGSAAGKVDKAAPIGSTVSCTACHNQATVAMDSVQFLSTEGEGEEAVPVVISGLGSEARCMVCHQGRATKTQVDALIARFKAENPDTVVAPIKDAAGKDVRFGFINVHYFAAAITLYGNEVHGGYEYEGKVYDAKNDHVLGYDSCVECHDPHTTQVRVNDCKLCHEGVTTADSLKKIRMVSSAADYDGDGNIKEGMNDELTGMRDALLKGIKAYAKDVVKTGITYDPAAHPYFFQDKDNNGQVDKNETGGNVAYSTWTPRLLKAAYNYQVASKDPGAYAHGNKYIVQLVYDSIEDLNTKLTTKIDMTKMSRDDAGHFAGNTEAFRHWDAEEMTVPGSCAKCHSADGLPTFISNGVNVATHASNGFQCATCHNEENFPELLAVAEVTFPSGAKVTFGENDPNNLCLQCHQGRESTTGVDRVIGTAEADTVNEKLTFRNVHYFAAGATLFGSEAQGAYQYAGKEYAGRFEHVKGAQTCSECHDAHELAPNPKACAGCHKTEDLETIRLASKADFDGDGNVTEGLAGEIETSEETLYKALQAYAKDVVKVGIVYNSAAHPYFFQDKDNDGKIDVDETGANVRYSSWTPRLLRAAYNYQYAHKDPGGYVHNAPYILQTLYDSVADLNTKLVKKVDMSKMVRPEVEAE